MHWAGAFTAELALRAVDDLLGDKGVDEVVALSGLYAARISTALRQRGRRVADDVAIVGCDNLLIGAGVEPLLTTVCSRVLRLARAMVGTLFELLDNGPPPPEWGAVVIQPELMVRESS